jgi:hypothetical protein
MYDYPIATANSIVQDYDFIGITERLDESLVVLSMLLKIPLGDVLHLDNKRSGGFDSGGGGSHRCFWIHPTHVTPEMQAYLESAEWQAYIAPERRLYEAANHSLDLTIEALGRVRVADQVALFERAQRVALERCSNVTRFPCTSSGERRIDSEVDCLTEDFGCGLECLDQVAMELGLNGINK